jgi:hypothetical protein
MKKKKNNKSKGILAKYKAQKTKGDLKGTGLKTLVDLLVGATVGAGIGASAGRAALPIGLVLIAGSHYMDEDTGILRLAGSATIAYGIGKAISNKNIADATTVSGFSLAGETSKAKSRLTQFKDELITAFYLDKVIKKKEDQIGAIDLSSLEIFDQNNKNESLQYQINADALPEPTANYGQEDFAFDLVEEPDLSSI